MKFQREAQRPLEKSAPLTHPLKEPLFNRLEFAPVLTMRPPGASDCWPATSFTGVHSSVLLHRAGQGG